MPASQGLSMLVGLGAMLFVAPSLAPLVAKLDPLLVILGIFVLLGLLQQAGFSNDSPGEPSQSSSHSGGRDTQTQVHEPSAQELIEEAERCLAQNSYEAVQERSQKALDLDPECIRAWELQATALKWLGKREEAAAVLRKAKDIYEVESPGLAALLAELEASVAPMDVANECETKGEDLFAKRHYDLAIECYNKGLDALGASSSKKTKNGGSAEERVAWLRLLSRRAECAQQLQDWRLCLQDATALLEEDPKDAKALLQRAISNEALEKFAAALDDARALLAVDPKNTAANRLVHNCQKALRE